MNINLSELWDSEWQESLARYSPAAAAAAAKSPQSCPTLGDPIDGSPPGSSVPGILQARTLEWVAISFSNAWKWKVKVKSLSRVRLLASPWAAAHQAPLFMGFSRQEWVAIAFCCCSPWGHKESDMTLQLNNKKWRWQFSVHFSSVTQSCPTLCNPWTAAHQASLSITNSWSLLKLTSIESVMPSNHLILCRPLLLLPSIFPSIRVFSNEWILRIRWPKDWSFNFNLSPSNEYSGLISFRMDWLNFFVVQGTLKSLLQHYSSKASILRHSSFFIVQLSHPYMTTGKIIALTRQTFVGNITNICDNFRNSQVIY